MRDITGEGAKGFPGDRNRIVNIPKIPEPYPEPWDEVFKLVYNKARKRITKVMVVGAVDTGKSTLAGFLFAKALQSGFAVLYLDLDIGQSTISLPLTVASLKILSEKDLEKGLALKFPHIWDFVPSNSPRNIAPYHLAAGINVYNLSMRGLEAISDRKIIVLIDTTGYVSTLEALNLKILKLRAFRPDALVIIYPKLQEPSETSPETSWEGKDRWVYHNLRVIEEHARSLRIFTIKLERSPFVIPRDRDLRSSYRSNKLRAYFQGLRELLLPEDLLLYSPHGFNLRDIFDISQEPQLPDSTSISEPIKGLILGLYQRYKFLGLGLLRGWEKGKVKVEVPSEILESEGGRGITHLLPSNILVNASYRTVPLRRPSPIEQSE